METNYNEKLRNESIASVKAIKDYAYERAKYKYSDRNYWVDVHADCEEEMELRIKQIFP